MKVYKVKTSTKSNWTDPEWYESNVKDAFNAIRLIIPAGRSSLAFI